MRRRILTLVAATALTLAVGPQPAFAADARVTGDDPAGSYVRYDGGTDETLERCSEGRRQQNEPTVAVNPHDPGRGRRGLERLLRLDREQRGLDRLLPLRGRRGPRGRTASSPGTRATSSEAGLASPVHGSCGAAGDPTQAFDADGNLFYGFICFNRSKPINGGVYVAKYINDGATYDRTTLVKRGTPSGLFQAGPVPGQDQPHRRPDRR